MAVNSVSNLFPPIIDTFMPAFLKTTGCKVYFNLTDYNSFEDIKSAQVTLVYQNTNRNALNKAYKNGIKNCPIYIEDEETGNPKYYILINPADLEVEIGERENEQIIMSGGFDVNTFYKVQIRFNGKEDGGEPINNLTDGWAHPAYWYTDNLNYFSEWSTVCIIKAINKPTFDLNINDVKLLYLIGGSLPIVNSNNIKITGTFYYDEGGNNNIEVLDYYYLTLKKNNDIIYTSDVIYTNKYSNPNEINYLFNKRFEDGQYTLELNYSTSNGYIPSREEETLMICPFIIDAGRGEEFLGSISALIDEDDGRIKVKVESENNFDFPIAIFRSCIDTDFEVRELVYTFNNTEVNKFIWFDYTTEAGKFYHYYACVYNDNKYGLEVATEQPILSMYDDMFFTAEDMQLKIKYNQNVNSYKPTISIGKVDTIGSKYPFIRKSGSMNYKTFSISGIVSCISDENSLFMKDEEKYYNSTGIKLYKEYNLKNNITSLNDYIAEKKFRDKAIEFFNDAKVKLFRSLTEGNVLVKITDVSLTPNQSLGRRIWTFTATCVEVDDFTLTNCFKYNIQSAEGNISAPDNNIIFAREGSTMAHAKINKDGTKVELDEGIDKDILKSDSIKEG